MKKRVVFPFALFALAAASASAANADNAIQADAPTAIQPAAPATAPATPTGNALPNTPPVVPTAEEMQQMQSLISQLDTAIKELKAAKADEDLVAEAEAPLWVAQTTVKFPEEFFTQGTVNSVIARLKDGLNRAAAVKNGNPIWTTGKGSINRAFRSKVDGTPQPYKIIIPSTYDGSKPAPLYVYLHGRGDTDLGLGWVGGGNGTAGRPGERDSLQLQVFGRANCSFRFPGETDVFEALAAVKRHYNIDPDRIVLAGFSMGGAGSWSVGLHQPDWWCGLEIDAGVIGDRRNMDGLTPAQKGAAVTYGLMPAHALNVVNVPLVGYAGERDAQLAASKSMADQLEKEGYHLEDVGPLHRKGTDINALFLAQPGQGHVHASGETLRLINEFTNANFARGRVVPDQIRFITYTTRYNQDYWITVDGMQQSFDKALVDATRDAAKQNFTIKTQNVARLLVADAAQAKQVAIDGETITVKPAATVLLVRNDAGHWQQGDPAATTGLRKQHNLQGPVNDAFFDSFLCVTPTGTAFNAIANERGQQELARFSNNFRKEYRGDTRTKTDAAITADDIANNNLVLFGDPGSNAVLAKIASQLPIKWTKDSIVVGDKTYSAADHVPVLIYPNPLNPKRYVVINTGLLGGGVSNGNSAPQGYGDFAILQLAKQPDGRITERVAQDGLFDEAWKLPKL